MTGTRLPCVSSGGGNCETARLAGSGFFASWVVYHIRYIRVSMKESCGGHGAARRACRARMRCYASRYEGKRCYADLECFGHGREFCLVCEVGLGEVVGLGNAANFWGGGVRRGRDLSVPGSAGRAWQGNEYDYISEGWRRSRGQGRVDVGVGG